MDLGTLKDYVRIIHDYSDVDLKNLTPEQLKSHIETLK